MSEYMGPPRTEPPINDAPLPPIASPAQLLPPEQDFEAIDADEESAQRVTARLAALVTAGLAAVLIIAAIRAAL